jgi:hypothetical protein
MYRTEEQEREYQSLSSNEKKRYDLEVSLGANHENAYKMVAINKRIIDELDTNPDVNIKGTVTMRKILKGAMNFIRDNAPSVWRSVKDAFNNAISYLDDLIHRGIDWISDNIIDPIITVVFGF